MNTKKVLRIGVVAGLAGGIAEGAVITVDADGDELVVGWHEQQPENAAKSQPREPVVA